MTANPPQPNNNHPEIPWWKLHLKSLVAVAFVIVILAVSGVYLGESRTSSSLHLVTTTTSSTTVSNVKTTSTFPPVGTGYLATGASFVDFIQWSDGNDTLSGSAQVITTTGQPPNMSTTSNTIRVTGTIQGSTISLSFGGAAATFGTVSGESVVLNFPQSDGTLAPITFQQANAAAYNKATAGLENAINTENQVASQAQAVQAQLSKIDSQVQVVDSDLSSLSTTGLSKSVGSVQNALQQEAQALTTTQTAEQKVLAEAPNGNQSQTCYDATSGVGYDAESGVGYEASSGVGYEVTSLLSSIQSLRNNVQALQPDFSQLLSDESTLPNYLPQNAPSQSEINQAVATTDKAIASAIATTNGYIGQANTDVTTAFQYVAQAYQAGNCGSPPSTPSPMTQIS